MRRIGGRIPPALVGLLLAAALGWIVFERIDVRNAAQGTPRATKAVPVEVASVQRGPMELKRTFSAALEARAEFVVAPKVSGRVERFYANLGDSVKRGQVVAELDDDAYVQEVAQAGANLAVAKANVSGAQSALDIATRELDRMRRLRERGVASEAQFDTARANQLNRKSQLAVAHALVTKAESELRSANIRLGYTKVTAGWRDGSGRRFVAERFVDEGQTVSANEALLRIVEFDPVIAVIYVAERDYARLDVGQAAVLTTDAFPGQRFEARIERIAPVFSEQSRQARVELSVANDNLLLKPGMFTRTTIVLDRIAEATHVPEQALTTRDGKDGVFVVNEDGTSVAWREVDPGIRQDGRVQVIGSAISGRVVVLGQQLLKDGSPITVASRDGSLRLSRDTAAP